MGAALALLALPPGVHAQAGQGTITGLIRDQMTGAPLPLVQVSIGTLRIGAVAQDNGTYVIPNVPAGTHAVTVTRIGFRATTVDVTVSGGGNVTQDFFLSPQALQLEEIVATGTAQSTRVREIGNAVSRVDASIATVQPIPNVSSLMRGRVAGLAISEGSGAVGTASAIRIRGASTMRLANDGPLIYIDGVRVSNEMTNTSTDVSALDDLDPSLIESIQVIKGPAAATLYGTEAANGVIQITTRNGGIGTTQWNFTSRQGMNWFHDPEGRTPTNWGLNTATGQMESINMMAIKEEREAMLRSGRIQYYGAELSGGTGSLRYFLGGSADFENGVTENSWVKRYNGRLNVDVSPTEKITVSASNGFTLNRLRLPTNFPYQDAVYATPAHLDSPRRGYRVAPPETRYFREHNYLNSNRLTSSVTLSHNATSWFTHRLTVGLDATDQEITNQNRVLPPEHARFFSARLAGGSTVTSRRTSLYSTFDYGASALRDLSQTLASTTSAGLQIYTRSSRQVQANGVLFPALGLTAVNSAAERTGSEAFSENNTVGVYLQQQVGWRDRVFLTAAVRADDNSAFGDEFELVYYPKVSGSWVVSDEDFWGVGFIPSFRLRAAYGHSGQQPDAFDSFRTYSTRPSPTGGATVLPSAPGNAALGPEVGVEIEAGFDAELFGDRLQLEFSYYNQKTLDAIVARDVAPSSGFLERQFVNIGQVSNVGVEVGINARLVDHDAIGWDLGLTFATNRNRIDKLGLDGFLGLGWVSRHAEGYAVGSLWAPRVIEATLDPDGIVRNFACDNGQGVAVTCNEEAWIYIGHPDPKVEGSLTTGLTIGNRLTIQGLLHGKFGQHKYDLMQWSRLSAFQIDEMNKFPERFDPRDVAAAQYGNTGEFDLWVRDASFIRFRELSAVYSLPTDWAGRLGASRGQISLAVRNPFGGIVWTRWPNPWNDPEVVDPSNTFSGNREPQSSATTPPLSSLVLSVRLGY